MKLTDEQIKEMWVQYRAALPRYLCFARAIEAAVLAQGEPVGINGLTEAETAATASVMGFPAPVNTALLFQMQEAAKDLAAKNTALLEKAKAVVERWETPLWKDVPATAVFIYELRNAIAQAEGKV